VRATEGVDAERSTDELGPVDARLMRRTFAIDTLACPACGGRLRLLGVITKRATGQKILEHLGIAAEPVVVPRARGPDWPDP
jgi:hypothetical protein